MRTSHVAAIFAGFVGLAASAADLLFISSLEAIEYQEATGKLGYTVDAVSNETWYTMTTADFAKYKAIIISDEYGGSSPSYIQFLVDTKAVWSPAVTGNMIIIGTDPSNHASVQPGAVTLIDNSVGFAASGTGTGLYLALSQYYDGVTSATVDALSYFGDFEVRGDLDCYNEAHKVADAAALKGLSDDAISNWSCSVHEAFSKYPTSGVNGFQALAIAKDVLGVGSQPFADGTVGLPYIISRGAIPTGCGNGVFEPQFNEECDDGPSNGAPGDLCTAACKCKYGLLELKGGVCAGPPSNSTSSSSTIPPPISSSSTSSVRSFGNSTTRSGTLTTPTASVSPITVLTTTTATTCPSCKPTSPPPVIVGIEIIYIIDIVEYCPAGSTVTTTITSCLSTMQRPIYRTSTSGLPCYPCMMGTPATSNFATVYISSCPTISTATPTVTVKLCNSCALTTYTTTIPGYTPAGTSTCNACTPFITPVPHSEGMAMSTVVVTGATTVTPAATTVATAVVTSTAKTTTTPAVVSATPSRVVTAGASRAEAAAMGFSFLGALAYLLALA